MFAAPHHHKQGMITTVLPIARPWTPPDTDMESEDDQAQVRFALDDEDMDAHNTPAIADSGYFGDVNTPSRGQRAAPTWSRSSSSASDRSEVQHQQPVSKIPTRRVASINKRTFKPRSASGRLGSVNVAVPMPAQQPFSSKNKSQAQRPQTPTRQISFGQTSDAGAPSFPATPPDSARMPDRTPSYTFSEFDDSPLPYRLSTPSPVDMTRNSPVQNALFSCLNNLERLIGTSQPDADQMEHIISQFEGLTSFLSAPSVETRKGAEGIFSSSEDEAEEAMRERHIFSGLDTPTKSTGLKEVLNLGKKDLDVDIITKEEAEAYVAEVGNFIDGVKAHSDQMKARLDEVHALNELNTEIIAKLRKQLKATKDTVDDLSEELSASRITIEELRDELHESKELIGELRGQLTPRKNEEIKADEEEDCDTDTETVDEGHVARPAPGFWSSFTGALDSLNDMLYEW